MRPEALKVAPGSLAHVAAQSGRSLAETLGGAEVIVLLDASGSMAAGDSRGGRTRFAVALEALAALQARQPGRVALIAFSDAPELVPGGVPRFLGGSTDVAAALRLARVADAAGMRCVLVSDGEPDSAAEALAEAGRYRGRIDTIYVGPESGEGRRFLARLAAAHGGQAVVSHQARELLGALETLRLGAGH